MLDKFKAVYDKLPKDKFKFFKYMPDVLLFGGSYCAYKNKITFSDDILDNNLYNILKYSKKHTRFGREKIPHKFYVDEVRDVLRELPFITSDELSENMNYYKSDEYNKMNSYATTTGGTGRRPTTVVLANESYGIEWAHMHKIWETLGYSKTRCLKLTLRGKSLAGDKLVEYNPIYNELVVDTFKLNKKKFERLFSTLQKYHIQYLHGYPSLVKEFLEYCQCFDLNLNLEGIFLGSEGASVEERRALQDYFNCKVVSWYGQTEKVVLAADFETNGRYKIFTSYGTATVYKPDEQGYGEIVGTTFVNRALPLINYRTGDYGRLVREGNYIFLKDIVGRWGKDYVYLDKDKKIPTSSINLHSMIQDEILFFQIYQREYGRLFIKILPKFNAQLSDDKIVSLFSNDIEKKLKEFTIEYKIVRDVNEIMKSHRGKMIMLVQETKIQEDENETAYTKF
jgi:phenylacetate-CoA ligase